ncbi:hypothetical protein D9M71_816190 [compost metagenome]
MPLMPAINSGYLLSSWASSSTVCATASTRALMTLICAGYCLPVSTMFTSRGMPGLRCFKRVEGTFRRTLRSPSLTRSNKGVPALTVW